MDHVMNEYLIRLAKFYILVNKHRTDKLNMFPGISQKDAQSMLFTFAFGGDGAPICGTSFLVSFKNVGKRISSSSENFLVFGGDADKNSVVVRRFVLKVLSDIEYLES